MNIDLKPYVKYIAANLYWLNQIPAHWESKRVAILFDEKKDKNKNYEIKNAFQFKFGEIVEKKQLGTEDELKDTYVKYTFVEKDDIVINGLNLNYDFATQRIGLVQRIGIITSAYISISPKEYVNPKYACYIFKSMDNIKMLNGIGTGIRLTLSFGELKKQYLPVPPRPEQDQIVRFLDFKISKINKFIKEKKREIELLKEQKQAKINRVVTKGLKSNVPMKESGIEWLGEVPAHWEVKRIKNVLIEMEERSMKGDEEPLSMSQKRGIIKSSDLSIPNMTSSYVGGKIAHKNDLVFNKLKAHLGVFSVSKYEGVVSPDYAVYSVLNKDNVEYIERLFKTKKYIQQFIRHSRGIAAGFRRLYTNDLFSIKIVLPKSYEQHQIIDYIINLEVKINKAISAIESEINLVQEYKISLISDIITGKVDVRDVKIDEFLELETLDETEAEIEAEELTVE